MGAEGSADLRIQPGPHVFCDDLETVELDADDRHHLSRVVRLRPGDPLTVSDAHGRWRSARFGDTIEPTGPIVVEPEPPYPLGLGIALTKACKPELVVQKATELGIDHIVLFEARHSVAHWDTPKRERNVSRLTRVAREASMQSRQVHIPEIVFVNDLAEVADTGAMRSLGRPVRADFGGARLAQGHRFVVIGPEGGWNDGERTQFPEAVDLGRTVLRAETAALVVAARMVGQRDQIG